MAAPSIGQAFALLQQGRAADALEVIGRVESLEPAQARGALARGLALRALGREAESRAALEAGFAMDPDDYAIAYERALACQRAGEEEQALAAFERASRLRPAFAPARFAAGMLRFRRRQWQDAIAHFSGVLEADHDNVPALVNLGQALAEDGRFDEAEGMLARAVRLRPEFAEARHALGWALHKAGKASEAIAWLQAAAAGDAPADWLLDLAKALDDAGFEDDSVHAYERALEKSPRDAVILRSFGRSRVRRGEFDRASELFMRALEGSPDDAALPLWIAQVELVAGRFESAWRFYARREPRIAFERRVQAAGKQYRVPALADLRGKAVTLVAEQGLGDILFFLRFARALRERGVRMAFAGEPRLRGPLERTGWFDEIRDAADPSDASVPILVGDLPAVAGFGIQPALPLAADVARVGKAREALERMGPPPWIGVTWRAGTAHDVVAHALFKEIPLHDLMQAIAPMPGTVFALQRELGDEERERAASMPGRPVHDLSALNEDPEDALAVMSLFDRYIGVSNTNMHLRAACGRTADTLVPFPPEWRWGLGGDSPWFPGFRVHRQERGGGWDAALSGLSRTPADGNRSRE